MKQKLYALDAFFIEKLKLSENDPYIYTGCIFAHVQINFYIYAIAFTCPKIHPGANYTYMYNLHTVCKLAHVNGA